MYNRLPGTNGRIGNLQWYRLRPRLPAKRTAELQRCLHRSERRLQRSLPERSTYLFRW